MGNFDDWLAICETKARYCRCLDTKDWDGYADCFTDDYHLEVPPDGNAHTGREAAVRYVRSCVETSRTNHHVHNPEITFDDPDAADAIWAMQDRNVWDAERRREMGCSGHTGFGHYHERYVRCPDGKWRIRSCRLSYLHMDRYDVEPSAGD